MTFLLQFACAIAAVVVGWRLWRILEDRDDAPMLLWYVIWLAKGLLLPLLVWSFLDWMWVGRLLAAAQALVAQGLSASVPARSSFVSGPWPATPFDALVQITGLWGMVNFLWQIAVAHQRLHQRAADWTSASLVALFFLPIPATMVLGMGWGGLPWALAFSCGVLAHCLVQRTDVAMPAKALSYSGAVGHLKMGRFDQAEQSILEQLETAQEDFTGWMMLAELYAMHFRDMVTADRTVHDLCAQPNLNPSQVSVALHKLADWYLAVEDDPVAARNALEEVEMLYPGTHLAFMARQRMNRLPANRAEWESGKRAPTIRLRPGGFRRSGPNLGVPVERGVAERRVEELRTRLEGFPDDARAREELARLLEGPMKQPDEAMAQLGFLLALRGPSREQRGEWLNLLATWQLRHLRGGATSRETLVQLVREHPGTEAAELAAQRLRALDIEDRLRGGAPPAPAIAPPPPARMPPLLPPEERVPEDLPPSHWE